MKAVRTGSCGNDPIYSIYADDKHYGYYRGTYCLFYSVSGRQYQRMREIPARCVTLRTAIDKAIEQLTEKTP